MLQPGDVVTLVGAPYRYRGRTFYRVELEEFESCGGCDEIVIDHPHVWSTIPSNGSSFFYCDACHKIAESVQKSRSKRVCSASPDRPARSTTPS